MSGATEAGTRTITGRRPRRRGEAFMCFSILAVMPVRSTPLRSAHMHMVVTMQEASPAATRSVGLNAEASPPMSRGASVRRVAPSGCFRSHFLLPA